MFFVKQMLSAAIKNTPEGRVYYPNGRAGYQVDACAEAKVERFLTTFFFIQIAIVMVFVSVGSETNHRLSAMIVCVGMLVAIRYVGLRIVLRNAPRAAAPMLREDAIRRTAAVYGSARIYLMLLVVLVLVPTPLFVLRNEPPWERAAVVAVLLAMAIYALVFAARVLRVKAAIARVSTEDA